MSPAERTRTCKNARFAGDQTLFAPPFTSTDAELAEMVERYAGALQQVAKELESKLEAIPHVKSVHFIVANVKSVAFSVASMKQTFSSVALSRRSRARSSALDIKTRAPTGR